MDERVFKRINIFKGFIRTTKDYQSAVSYHLTKRRLHNRSFHGAGVVRGISGELQVRQRRVPTMAVEIRGGYALSPGGQDIMVHDVHVKELDTTIFRPPQTVFLVLKYQEDKSDWVELNMPGFPASKGFSRIAESFTIDWSIAEPDPRKQLELCRVKIGVDTTSIRNPEVATDPRAGEIDTRFVPKAGICRGWLGWMTLEQLRRFLQDAIATYTHLHRSRNVPNAGAAAAACVSLLALAEAGILDQTLFEDTLRDLARMVEEVDSDLIMVAPGIRKTPAYKKSLKKHELADELLASLPTMTAEERLEASGMIFAAQTDSLAALKSVVRPPEHWKISESDLVAGKAIRVLDGTEWDRVKEDSAMPYQRLLVENQEWRLIDTINLLDPESESEHRFEIGDAIDWFRSQVSLKYPDQAIVRDEGIGHEGGFASWEVHNVTPGLPVVVVRRMDFARADYLCRVWVNDLEAGEVPCPGQDTRYRWRNWPFMIDGNYVRHSVLRLKQGIETANRDVNYFRLWFYQPV